MVLAEVRQEKSHRSLNPTDTEVTCPLDTGGRNVEALYPSAHEVCLTNFTTHFISVLC